MNETLDLFRKWNNALIKYFFHNNDCNEIFIYVNENILNEIGEQNHLGDYKQFLNIVLLDINQRKTLYYDLAKLYGLSSLDKKQCLLLNGKSIIGFARLLAEKFKEPFFFNYIILCIYIVSECQEYEESAIGKYLQKYLTDYFPDKQENGKRDGLDLMFDKLHKIYPAFRDITIGKHRYVGLLKYQLILSNHNVEEIKNALHYTACNLEDWPSYEEIIAKIYDYVNEEVKNILKRSLSDAYYKCRIENIINTFDNEYFESTNIQNTNQEIHKGEFAWAINLVEKNLCLLTNINDTDININGIHIRQGGLDRIAGYNCNFVEVSNKIDLNSTQNITLVTDNYSIKPIPTGDIVFFYKYNENLAIQSRHTFDKKTFIAIKNNTKGEIDKAILSWVKKNTRNLTKLNPNIAFQIFGKGWELYATDGVTAQYYNILGNNEPRYNSINDIVRKGGIIPPQKNNVYLINALPLYEFPENIDEEKLNIYINISGKPIENIRFRINGNLLILDLSNYELVDDISPCIDLSIEYKTLSIKDSFYVCGQDIKYNSETLFKFNSFGEYIENTSNDIERYVQGNKFYNCNLHNTIEDFRIIQNLSDININSSRFHLVNLLSACCFMEENGVINEARLKKCIKYSADIMDLDTTEDNFYTKVRYLLINSGHLCAQYGNPNKYQTIPPTFIKIPRSFSGIKNQQVYMLTGCYTKKFLSDLARYCTTNNIQIYTFSNNSNDNFANLLPPAILLNYNFTPNDFSYNTKHQCETYSKEDLAVNLLSFLNTINDFESTLKEANITNKNLLPTDSNIFPRIRTDNNPIYIKHYYIEEQENSFRTSRIKDSSWMNLYCISKKLQPVFYVDDNSLYVPSSIHLQYLMQRALYMMNIGLPRYEKAYITGRSIENKKLYYTVKIYNINLDGRNAIFSRITKDIQQIASQRKINRYLNMELWTCNKDLDENLPKKMLVLKNTNYGQSIITAIAIIGHNFSLYLYDGSNFKQVKGDAKANLDFAINNPMWQNHDFEFTATSFNIPNAEYYKIENLIIL